MRYLPLTEADRREMLAEIGAASVAELYRDVPAAARLPGPIPDLPGHRGELEVERLLTAMAAKSVTAGSVPFFLGGGAYRHHVPATVDSLIQRGEFLTAYTPYQPEIAQGTLQYLFEFQTQVALLTGMEVANASMYDGATACAEAVMMANRITRRSRAVLAGNLHPHYRDTTQTLARFNGFEIAAGAPAPAGRESLADRIDAATSCVVVQSPDVFGHVHDLTALAAACQAKGALLIAVVTEAVSLGLLTPPGAMGADIVVGEGQSLGLPLGFGGPYLGLFAAKEKYLRQMPGRLIGQTVDADGRRGWVLTLSTREQHIRREKATSNICTNSGLCALAFTMHLTLLGEAGFTDLARLNHAKAVQLAEKLGDLKGLRILTDGFFNEFTIDVGRRATKVVTKLAKRGLLAGVPATRLFPDSDGLTDLLLVTATECTTEADMDALARGLGELL
ncbi:MAG: aminomethyl-transferring glycine dehydrogenase subunit GcvPA [Rhodospirillaceae bacterium]